MLVSSFAQWQITLLLIHHCAVNGVQTMLTGVLATQIQGILAATPMSTLGAGVVNCPFSGNGNSVSQPKPTANLTAWLATAFRQFNTATDMTNFIGSTQYAPTIPGAVLLHRLVSFSFSLALWNSFISACLCLSLSLSLFHSLEHHQNPHAVFPLLFLVFNARSVFNISAQAPCLCPV